MLVDELHRQVAAVALRAAAGHGFALGGGNALIAHGIIARPTEDVAELPAASGLLGLGGAQTASELGALSAATPRAPSPRSGPRSSQ